MAWGNEDGQWHDQNMDSQGKQLAVHSNTGAETLGNNRVVIAERVAPPTLNNALKLVGNTDIEYYEDGADHVAGSIKADSGGLWVNARIRAEGSTNGDPNIAIGWTEQVGSTRYGNTLEVDARLTHINSDSLVIGSAVHATSDTAFVVDSRIHASHLDSSSSSGTVAIGDTNAGTVALGKEDKTTLNTINGNTILKGANGSGPALEVQGDLTLADRSGQPSSNLYVSGVIQGAGLDINGNGDVSGDLAVHGDLNDVQTVHCAHLTAGRSCSIVQGADENSLLVQQTSATSEHAALYALANASNPDGVGIQINAPLALIATGKAKLAGDLDVTGQSTMTGDLEVSGQATFGDGITSAGASFTADVTHNAGVDMQGNKLHMGEGPNGSVYMIQNGDRMEFYVEGVLHFYVDRVGGHNA